MSICHLLPAHFLLLVFEYGSVSLIKTMPGAKPCEIYVAKKELNAVLKVKAVATTLSDELATGALSLLTN